MRALHVISSISRKAGGPAVAVGALAAEQRRLGLDVGLVATYREGEDLSAAADLQERGVKVRLVGPCGGPLVRCRSLKEEMSDAVSGAHVVHVHGMWEEVQYQAAAQCHHAGIPFIVTPHGMLSRWSLAQHWLKKALYLRLRMRKYLQRAAALHCTSAIEAGDVKRLDVNARVIVEPLGVDFGEFNSLPESGHFRKSLGISQDAKLIVYLGRIFPGKGLEYLVPALSTGRLSDIVLAAVGPDSRGFERQIRQLAADIGVAERVHFTGMLNGSRRIGPLVDADIVALPSDHENFGLSVVEALAAGTPVLVSDKVNIFRELVDAGVAVLCTNDVVSVAEVLGTFFSSADHALAMRSKARAFAFGTYALDAIAARWIGHYQDFCQLSGHAGAPSS